MNPCVRLVNERFPNLGERAARLYERDEAFHELCDDYQACVEATVRLQSTPGPGPEGLRKEYAALRLRLECELLRYLEEHTNES
jgi:hypothetical protein